MKRKIGGDEVRQKHEKDRITKERQNDIKTK